METRMARLSDEEIDERRIDGVAQPASATLAASADERRRTASKY
jgi:hypothetical protein